jgi:hypothetical protein
MFWLVTVHQNIHYVNLPGIEKWKILQQNFGKTGWNKSGCTLLKTELFCLNSFMVKGENQGSDCEDWKRKSTMEILCWRFKRKERWDDYMSYYEEAINKHLQNMHLVCDSGNKEMSRYIVAKIIWEEIKHTDIKLPELDDDIKVNIEIYKDVLKKRKETDLAAIL